MLAQILAAEFTVARPESLLGWTVLGAILFTLLYVFIQGWNSFFGKWEGGLKDFFWGVFFILALVFLFTERPWENENLIEGEVNVVPVSGVHAETDPGYHVVDPDHTHENN